MQVSVGVFAISLFNGGDTSVSLRKRMFCIPYDRPRQKPSLLGV